MTVQTMTEKINSDGKWPSPESEMTLDGECCFVCGFGFATDDTTRQEEIGIRGVNGDMCYNCWLNSVGYSWDFYSVQGDSNFHLNLYHTSLWSGDYSPVVISDTYWELSESDRSLIEDIARVGEPAVLEEVSIDELSEKLVYAIEPEFCPGMKSPADDKPSYPRPLVITHGTVYTPYPDRIRDVLGERTVSTDNTEQGKLF